MDPTQLTVTEIEHVSDLANLAKRAEFERHGFDVCKCVRITAADVRLVLAAFVKISEPSSVAAERSA